MRSKIAWRLLLGCFLVLGFSAAGAQTPTPELLRKIQAVAWLSKDSVELGEPVRLTLVARYPESLNMLFPDSTYNFSPFEYDSRSYSATRTDNGISTDSVVYKLSTFELQDTLRLQLPVFCLEGKDSIYFYANPVEAVLKQNIDRLPQNPQAKQDVFFLRVHRAFNTPYFLVGAGIVLVVLIVVLLVFGKRIWRSFRIWRLRKKHGKFEERFGSFRSQFPSDSFPAEQAVYAWKHYLEGLQGTPFTKLTSKEIGQYYRGEAIVDALKTFDRYLYGGFGEEHIPNAMEQMEDFASRCFDEKIQELKQQDLKLKENA
ncbi:MAG: hypothetical protein MI784_04990 [Cytophagales bacterium]|nr:hypothetical protein [Cytophagales bacterium]